MSRFLPAFAVRNPVTVVVGFVALCLLGAIALHRIALDMMPPGFEAPYVSVWIPWADATPLETETRIVKPVEEILATMPGIKSMRSRARASGGSVDIELHSSVDMAQAYNQVVDRMERVLPDLPDDVVRTYVYRWNPEDEPKLWLGLTIPPGTEDPYPLVSEHIQRRIERVPGVGQVELWGVDERIVWIDFDREALAAHGVDLPSLVARLRNDDVQLSGGRLTDRGEVRYLRSLARFGDLEALADYPVAPGLRLADVAEVAYRADPSEDVSHINGHEAAFLGVMAESGANAVTLCRETWRVIQDEIGQDPALEGFTFEPLFDQGAEIEKSLGTLRSAALEGGLLSLLVLFLFLREWRMTLLIAGCIPFALLITLTILYFTGGTLNLLSMAGMMIAVGMVVDNAIVVVETIYHSRQQHLERRQAAVAGTAEVALAVTVATCTSMIVFLPLILMSENAMFSFFMKALGLPVVWALGASLGVALVFTPLTTVFLGQHRIRPDPLWLARVGALYERALGRILAHRFDAVLALLALVVLTVALPMRAVGCSEETEAYPTEFRVRFEVPPSTTFTEREALVRRLEQTVDANAQAWGVRFHRVRFRGSGTEGWMHVQLLEPDEWPDSALPREEILEDVKKKLPEVPGVRTRLGWGGDPLGTRTVSVRMLGEDTETLERLAREAARRLEGVPGFLGAWASRDTERSREVRLTVEREASARYGLPARTVGNAVAFALRGVELPPLWEGDREVPVRARLAEADRQDIDTLLDLPLATPGGGTVPVRAVARSEVTRGFGTIRREDRRTALSVDVNLGDGVDRDAAFRLAGQALADLELPRGYSWEEGGQRGDIEASDEAQRLALLLSVVFVFLLMGVLFESLLLPVSVIATVPLAILGVWWTLFLTGTPLDVMGGVGLVVLVGVVVNNGIVLVDLVTRLRRDGMERTEALRTAGRRRLRPILMTAATTIMGVLPMALGTQTFVDIPYAPLGRVIAGGLATATLLTLFFVPLAYSLIDDLRAGGRRCLAFAWPRREVT
ncbi:MAG: efflux RND transporter permease subunit [Deltaproteobacteria bacterium]|nr:efflux RND transporter permease subunit [Deltaproteobacteria bacterium]